MIDNQNVKGADALINKLDKYPAALAAGVHKALIKAGSLLLRASKRIVPVDTGNLKASGFVRPEGKGWDTRVTVGYTASYALFVHENLENKHKPGKQAKFLEEPARIMQPELQKMIREELMKGIKGLKKS